MKRRTSFNPKRRIRPRPKNQAERTLLQDLAQKVSYGGNPNHKRNPGDFGLSPPSQPRAGKSLCDEVGIFTRAEAVGLLQAGVQRGLISEQMRHTWPQNIWAVTVDGKAVEAMLENSETGTYHGYPMREEDPLESQVLNRWAE